MEEPVAVARWSALEERRPMKAEVERAPLVIVRVDGEVHVLDGRCPHRGAHLGAGSMEGSAIVCAEHGWTFDCKTGQSGDVKGASVRRFSAWIDVASDRVMIDGAEVRAFQAQVRADPLLYKLGPS